MNHCALPPWKIMLPGSHGNVNKCRENAAGTGKSYGITTGRVNWDGCNFWLRTGVHKAPSTPATMSKQHSTLLPKTTTMSTEFIAKYRPFDKVETNWTCSICFDFVVRIVWLVAFDNVASTLLLVWTGQLAARPQTGVKKEDDYAQAALDLKTVERIGDRYTR